MSGKSSLIIAGSLVILGLAEVSAIDKPVIQSGLQMGYTYGQNGVGYPSFGKDPLGNPGRAGFYVSQLRLKASVAFDSTFSAVALGNLNGADLQEIYLEKRVRNYTFTAGKFRGAGLKSASGSDEFGRIAINAPRYARVWSYFKRTLGIRDFGVQAEADYFGGDVKHRFFIHNANRENVMNDEPSFNSGVAAQVGGFDYALDWRISPFTVWGGHLGAMSDHEWSEFVGKEEGWKVGNWFRTNPIVDASLNHQLDVGRFHMFNEAMLMYNRTIPNPVDSGTSKTWGGSSLVRFEYSERIEPFLRYEFFDLTDGAFPDDAVHPMTLGILFRPSPARYPGLKVTTEYVRSLEDGFIDSVPNDLLLCQLEMVF
ncbi:MAG: hypothetical protein JWP91_809 [Fibrobacteres bacterium]|nr:hypothetical protein [Fibrobacterota bacterium]